MGARNTTDEHFQPRSQFSLQQSLSLESSPSPPPKRSSSFNGGSPDFARNSIRYSGSSTTSPRRSNSFSLQMSSELRESHATTSAGPFPRKVHRQQPSVSGLPSGQAKITSAFNPSALALNLPSIQTSVRGNISPLTAVSPSPSTAQVVSALDKAVPDYFATWDETPRDFSQRPSNTRSRSANRGSSPVPASVPVSGRNREDSSQTRGHSRNRSQAGKGSSGTASSNKSVRQPSQKAMLSKVRIHTQILPT